MLKSIESCQMPLFGDIPHACLSAKMFFFIKSHTQIWLNSLQGSDGFGEGEGAAHQIFGRI